MARLVLATLLAASCAVGPQQEKNKGAGPPSSQPASQPTARTLPRNPRQAQIYEALLRDSERPRAPTILSREPGNTTSTAPGNVSLLLDGTPLSERPGRLVRSGKWSEFHFKAGGPAEGAPDVMEFNKNALLEAMETEAEAGVTEFIISAEVTRYRGRNYLNLWKYRRHLSHGNVSP